MVQLLYKHNILSFSRFAAAQSPLHATLNSLSFARSLARFLYILLRRVNDITLLLFSLTRGDSLTVVNGRNSHKYVATLAERRVIIA